MEFLHQESCVRLNANDLSLSYLSLQETAEFQRQQMGQGHAKKDYEKVKWTEEESKG